MNIYEKINTIMGDVKSLKKDGKVEFNTTKYKYLSEAKTTAEMREQLIKHKLVILPIAVQEKKEGQITHGLYTYELVNAENPEERITLQSGGQGHDSADKGSGKASSYAYKYLMWRTFAIPSNDDPDQIASDEIVENETKKPKEENGGAKVIPRWQGERLPDFKDVPDERVDALLTHADETKHLPVEADQLQMLYKILDSKIDGATAKIAKTYDVADLADLSREQWADAMGRVGKIPNKVKAKDLGL